MHVETMFFCRYFAGISFWSLGCYDDGKHRKYSGPPEPAPRSTRELRQKHILNIFEYANSPPFYHYAQQFQGSKQFQCYPRLLKTFRFPLNRRFFPCCKIGSKPRRTANSPWNFAQNSRCCGTLRGQGVEGCFWRSIFNGSVNGRQVCASC